MSRVSSITAVKAPSTVVAQSAYTYDDVGNRRTKTHPEYTDAYAYDELARLTSAARQVPETRPTSPSMMGYDSVETDTPPGEGGPTTTATSF